MNVVTLIGNLATDVELREVGPGPAGRDLPARGRPARKGRGRLRAHLDLEQAGGDLRPVPGEGTQGRRRRTPAEQLVGRLRRQQAERDRGRREPGRVPVVAGKGGGRGHPVRSTQHLPRIGGQWPTGTGSSPSRASCSTSTPTRTTGRWACRSPARREVDRIACGVSSSLELFERTASAGAQMLLVHHGLSLGPRLARDRRRPAPPAEDAPRRRDHAGRVPPRARRPPRARKQRPARARAGHRALGAVRAGSASAAPWRSPSPSDEFAARVRERLGAIRSSSRTVRSGSSAPQ